MPTTIRDATVEDLGAIVELLNATLATTTYEYTEVAHTIDSRRPWLEVLQARHFPVLVAVTDDVGAADGGVVGYAAYGDFRDSVARAGYRHTVEHSVHVAASYWGRGVGRTLMQSLFERAAGAGVHVMVGAIDSTNVDSIAFHTKLGFVETARMPEVGRKFDRWLDLVLMQRTIG